MPVQKLQFDGPLILCGPSDLEPSLLADMASRQYGIVAADGGANSLLAHNIVPDAIIGDFDSLDPVPIRGHDITSIRLDEQDSTDFEKCLYSVDAPVYLAFGFTGRRLDHTMASLHNLVKYHDKKNILLIGRDDVSFVTCGNFSFDGMAGQIVSIFPVEPVRFESSNGLKYPLDNLEIAVGRQIGTSNMMTGNRFEIIPTTESTKTPYLVSFPVFRLDDLIVHFLGQATDL